MTPDVSVIIPCYNTEHFVEEAINSALSQEGVEIEIIVIDDDSTDSTWDILKQLARRNPQIHLERLKSNSGQAIARNVGLDMAQGRYISFLDSDDCYVDSRVLGNWIAAAAADELDLCIAQFLTLNQQGAIKEGLHVPRLVSNFTDTKSNEASSICITGSCWQILYRRRFLERSKLKFSDKLRQREDRLFFVEAFIKANRIGVTQLRAIIYRIHADSTMRKITPEQLEMYSTHIESMMKLLEEARKSGRISLAFEHANAFAYWIQLTQYWRPLLVKVLDADGNKKDDDASEISAAMVRNYISRTQAMTHHCPALYSENKIRRRRAGEELKAEGYLDVVRLAVEAQREDLLLQLLKSDHRLSASQLFELVAASTADWAEGAAMLYLRYNRNAEIVAGVVKTAPPIAKQVQRVVLHVGVPKTGSSSMQSFIESNRMRLIDQGYWYPVFGAHRERGIRRDRTAGHLSLMRMLLGDEDDARKAERQLAAELYGLGKPIHTLFLSSENVLSHLLWPKNGQPTDPKSDPIRRIVHALGLKELEIAVVFRRGDDWFQSYYRELTSNPFNNFTATPKFLVDDLMSRGLFDFDALLSHFHSVKEVSDVHVASYRQLQAQGGSIPWILNILNLDPEGLSEDMSSHSNESFSDAAAGNIRLLKFCRKRRSIIERIFRDILDSKELRNSNFSLITPEDWDIVDSRIANLVGAFDGRFPREKSASRPEPNSNAPLPVISLLANGKVERTWNEFLNSYYGSIERSVTPINPSLASLLSKERCLLNERDGLHAKLQELEKEREYEREQLRQLKRELAAVVRSRPWRLIRPLSAALAFVRRRH